MESGRGLFLVSGRSGTTRPTRMQQTPDDPRQVGGIHVKIIKREPGAAPILEAIPKNPEAVTLGGKQMDTKE